MFTSHEERADPQIVALLELDMQRMRVRLVLARKAIRERMRELEHSTDHYDERQSSREVRERWQLDK
jgi:hypothetical protein